MKLDEDLAKTAETTETKEELKEEIKDAGIELEDNELDSVSGGRRSSGYRRSTCNKCGKQVGKNNCCMNPQCSKYGKEITGIFH